MNRLLSRWGVIAATIGFVGLGLNSMSIPAKAAEAAPTISTKQPFAIIVPWGQGGLLDGVARALAPILEKNLGRKVVIVNLPGNGTQDGHRAMRNALADGNTIGLVSLDSVTLGTTSQDLAITGYQPLVQLAGLAPVIVLPAKSPYRSVSDLLDIARANPGKLRASGSAFAGPWHLALAGLLKANGLSAQAITWIPSEGAGVALQDLSAGAIDFAILPAALAAQQIKSGTVAFLAVLSTNRIPGTPAIPTAAERGSAPYAFEYWLGLVGPQGMPAEVSQQLVVALTNAANDSAFVTALGNSGVFRLKIANGAEFGSVLSSSDEKLRDFMARVGNAN